MNDSIAVSPIKKKTISLQLKQNQSQNRVEIKLYINNYNLGKTNTFCQQSFQYVLILTEYTEEKVFQMTHLEVCVYIVIVLTVLCKSNYKCG